ncbi:hypothetical protein TIFTF001_025162 [Ficus carica]|uniref:Uncharacterized protein n=1 Tax=Ficus carica TaxID=3494 RepID=A0AA88API8_FICCA|nr:hypothetical protein TIFTF001_025162 [Ficus carica]
MAIRRLFKSPPPALADFHLYVEYLDVLGLYSHCLIALSEFPRSLHFFFPFCFPLDCSALLVLLGTTILLLRAKLFASMALMNPCAISKNSWYVLTGFWFRSWSCLILLIAPINASLSEISSVATTSTLNHVCHSFRLSCGLWTMMVKFCLGAANLFMPKNWLEKALFKSSQLVMEFDRSFINQR